MKKSNLGFSILEIVIAIVILNIAWTMVWASMDYSSQARKTLSNRQEIANKKSLTTRFLSEQSSWKGMIANNTSLRCITNGTCQSSQISSFREIQLVSASGHVVHPLSSAGKGFRLDGSTCDGFSESNPTDECPLQYLIEWRGICKSSTDCQKPRAEVRGSLRGKLSLLGPGGAGTFDFNFRIQDFSVSCPTNYAYIPGNFDLSTTDFCVAMYEMKAKTNGGAPVFDGTGGGSGLDVNTHQPESRPDGIPWTKISQNQASSECASLGADYHLITAAEWGTVARSIESVASNWTSGIVGTGMLNRGHSDCVGDCAGGIGLSPTAVADLLVLPSFDPPLLSAGDGTDDYAGTGNDAGQAWGSGREQKRTFTTSSGDIVWDFGGNARERIDADGLGSSLSYTGPAASGFFSPESPEVLAAFSTMTLSSGGVLPVNLFLPLTAGLTDATNFTGLLYISGGPRVGRALSKGGNFSSGNGPGIFATDFDSDPTTSTSWNAGFRCVMALP